MNPTAPGAILTVTSKDSSSTVLNESCLNFNWSISTSSGVWPDAYTELLPSGSAPTTVRFNPVAVGPCVFTVTVEEPVSGISISKYFEVDVCKSVNEVTIEDQLTDPYTPAFNGINIEEEFWLLESHNFLTVSIKNNGEIIDSKCYTYEWTITASESS